MYRYSDGAMGIRPKNSLMASWRPPTPAVNSRGNRNYYVTQLRVYRITSSGVPGVSRVGFYIRIPTGVGFPVRSTTSYGFSYTSRFRQYPDIWFDFDSSLFTALSVGQYLYFRGTVRNPNRDPSDRGGDSRDAVLPNNTFDVRITKTAHPTINNESYVALTLTIPETGGVRFRDGAHVSVYDLSHPDAPAPPSPVAPGAIDHVGDLIATLSIPSAITPAVTSVLSQTWTMASSPPAGFNVTRRTNATINVPRSLPTGMQGLVLRASVGDTVHSEVFLPWTAFVVGTTVGTRWTSNIGRQIYGIAFSSSAPRRLLQVNLQREFVTNSDLISIYGNGDQIPAESKLELLAWV